MNTNDTNRTTGAYFLNGEDRTLSKDGQKQLKKQPKTITKLTPAMVKFITNWENTMDELRG